MSFRASAGCEAEGYRGLYTSQSVEHQAYELLRASDAGGSLRTGCSTYWRSDRAETRRGRGTIAARIVLESLLLEVYSLRSRRRTAGHGRPFLHSSISHHAR